MSAVTSKSERYRLFANCELPRARLCVRVYVRASREAWAETTNVLNLSTTVIKIVINFQRIGRNNRHADSFAVGTRSAF